MLHTAVINLKEHVANKTVQWYTKDTIMNYYNSHVTVIKLTCCRAPQSLIKAQEQGSFFLMIRQVLGNSAKGFKRVYEDTL